MTVFLSKLRLVHCFCCIANYKKWANKGWYYVGVRRSCVAQLCLLLQKKICKCYFNNEEWAQRNNLVCRTSAALSFYLANHQSLANHLRARIIRNQLYHHWSPLICLGLAFLGVYYAYLRAKCRQCFFNFVHVFFIFHHTFHHGSSLFTYRTIWVRYVKRAFTGGKKL